jgi:hypothetical protein
MERRRARRLVHAPTTRSGAIGTKGPKSSRPPQSQDLTGAQAVGAREGRRRLNQACRVCGANRGAGPYGGAHFSLASSSAREETLQGPGRPRTERRGPGDFRRPRRTRRSDRGKPARRVLATLPHPLHGQPHGRLRPGIERYSGSRMSPRHSASPQAKRTQRQPDRSDRTMRRAACARPGVRVRRARRCRTNSDGRQTCVTPA